MAWITGLVAEKELDFLRRIGWKDEDPPESLTEEQIDNSGLVTRSFFVDSDVFEIMTGPGWQQ